jgi:hypothetical protein
MVKTSLAAANRSFCLPANRRRCLPAEQKEDGQHLFTQAIQKIAVLAQQTGTPCSGVLSQANESGLGIEKRSQQSEKR